MQTHPRARARRPVSTESSPASTMPRMTTKDPHAYSLPDPEDTRDTKSPERHPANMGDAGHRQSPSDRSGLDVIEGIRCDAGDAGDAGDAVAGHSLWSIQRHLDRLVETLFLWAIPRWVRPNHLTALRFVLIPVVLILLYFEYRWWGLGVFVVAMSTDFIDGAMARTRDQITLLGTYADPMADKLLVAAVLAWIGYEYLVVQIFLAFIVIELVLSAVGAGILLRAGTARSSNVFGKTKMIFQSVALLMFLISGILAFGTWKTISLYLLWIALALAVLSGGKQIYDLFAQGRQGH